MKSTILFILLCISSLSVFASTKNLECVGDLTKNDFSRRSHLVFNDETQRLEGYRGAIETGGITFRAKQSKGKIALTMTRKEYSKEEVLASANLPIDSDMSLTISLEEGFQASLVCSKKQ